MTPPPDDAAPADTAPPARSLAERLDFIRSHTTLAAPPLVPELPLWQATEITPLWQATEGWLAGHQVPPPFWAFAWAGGQALARHVLDHPALVAGRRVLDFASGSGLVALAAARAGAASVQAVEIDPFAEAAIRLNAAQHGLALEVTLADIIGRPQPGLAVLLAGDICYERPFAEAALAWFRDLAAAGTLVLMGDPGRTYLPRSGLLARATYAVPTTRELEDREVRDTTVWEVPPP
ncbi:class I SAM-dependent methyltransferase [Oleisolibacter albus]|uniref:class I SAM-dependent methyltransferase n=1 Tax=Oleisolibacter albus TaxID=2171757 RepID=UPI000DF308E6|nr:50S ribosomal protein L11 methyltransferase [Oleisolibacter albus]